MADFATTIANRYQSTQIVVDLLHPTAINTFAATL